MVVKRRIRRARSGLEFESSVISYGSQASDSGNFRSPRFESSVISYGSQAENRIPPEVVEFESSVISYGSQA